MGCQGYVVYNTQQQDDNKTIDLLKDDEIIEDEDEDDVDTIQFDLVDMQVDDVSTPFRQQYCDSTIFI